ncbi:MAG: hypothetical protein KME38_26000 [Spirirestis rafaelensis WJT71-NPBG6]|nr:hypothetical protein [Spirirestis rafaelensis WJT71-NPBG6]
MVIFFSLHVYTVDIWIICDIYHIIKNMSDRVYRQKSPSSWKPGAIQTKPAYAGFKFPAHAGGLCSYSRTVHGVGYF